MNILVLNPGSSTLKFGLYEVSASHSESDTGTSVKVLTAGVESTAANSPDHIVDQIVRGVLLNADTNTGIPFRIDAVGCRVVHGGSHFVEPTRITPDVLDELNALKDLAPLHIPADLAVLEQVRLSLPGVPVIAVFDTAFHKTLPEVARTYALPGELSSRYGLHRYGFHGISHSYVSRMLIEKLGRGANGTRVITCHLGTGASVCAVRDGRSIDTSMGLTPMEGLVMGTRSGDVDPGLVLYLIRAAGMSANEVDDILNHQSGLLGISGLSADLRALEEAAVDSNQRAELALEIFAYRTAKYIGAFAAALEGLDAIAFTGGIGEHSYSMRSRICRRLGYLGVGLVDERNRSATARISTRISVDGSPVQIWVIPTDEEPEIARAAYREMSGPSDG